MNFSIIIPTYNGAKKINHCLESLSRQNIQDFEIIVAIDGSTDETKEVVAQWNNKFNALKIFEQENGGRSKIRNFAFEKSKGDLVLFFDDDMTPENDVLELHLKHHVTYPNSILVGTQKSDPNKAKNDFEKYRSYIESIWDENSGKGLTKLNYPYLTAAHFSLPRELFKKLNGFDEKLTDVEDYDFAIRAFEQDIPIYKSTDAIAYHNDPVTFKNYILRKRQYAQGHLTLEDMYSERYRKYTARQFKPHTGIKKVIFNMAASKKLVKMVDSESIWLKLLPKSLRYKLYELIIHGLSNYKPALHL